MTACQAVVSGLDRMQKSPGPGSGAEVDLIGPFQPAYSRVS